MFKVLILQTQNNLSDERTEFYLRDRLTWMRFLGVGLGDAVPDANTIWTFREALTKAGAIERLFALFDRELRAAGYLAMSGQLVDASIVAAPKQRNTRDEKRAIILVVVDDFKRLQPARLGHLQTTVARLPEGRRADPVPGTDLLGPRPSLLLNRLLRIVRLLVDGLHLQARERKGCSQLLSTMQIAVSSKPTSRPAKCFMMITPPVFSIEEWPPLAAQRQAHYPI
jgi:hypothetical protein